MRINDETINSITRFVSTKCSEHKSEFDIYNEWAVSNGIVLHNTNEVKWVLDYIRDVKKMCSTTLKETLSCI